MVEKPSSPENVQLIYSFLELVPEETRIAKDSISGERALEEFLLLNENYTIERIN